MKKWFILIIGFIVILAIMLYFGISKHQAKMKEERYIEILNSLEEAIKLQIDTTFVVRDEV